MKLEHIGIAVANISEAKYLLQIIFGVLPYKTEAVESEGVITHFYHAGGVKIELLEATDPSSPIARFIEKRGQGIHHLAFSVDDAKEDFQRLTNLGLQTLGEGPKQGADGKHIFFVHPKDTQGILMEFCSNSD